MDGKIVREMGRRVDPDTAVVHVDGSRIVLREDLVHLVLNKPRGMLSTMADDRGRPCVGDLVADRGNRLFHVGRLDADTEGLLLLTNDGDLGHRLMHPSYEVQKTYLAEVVGQVPRDLGKRLRAGVELEDGPVAVDSFRMVDAHAGRSMVELVLHEGRKHVVRRLLDEVGHPVQRLVRTAIGDVLLGEQRARPDPAADAPRGGIALSLRRALRRWRYGRCVAPIQVDGDERAATSWTVPRSWSRPCWSATPSAPRTSSRSCSPPPPTSPRSSPPTPRGCSGCTDVPLLCASEIAVPGAMPRTLRLLAHVETERPRSEVRHVYLRGAAALRTDLPQ